MTRTTVALGEPIRILRRAAPQLALGSVLKRIVRLFRLVNVLQVVA
jgi:hypothetical protein